MVIRIAPPSKILIGPASDILDGKGGGAEKQAKPVKLGQIVIAITYFYDGNWFN